MIDHISFAVNNFEESCQFYGSTLAILGYERLMTFDNEDHQVAGYGSAGKPSFWIGIDRKQAQQDEYIGKARGFHVGFLAPNVEAVHQWYAKCLELGGTDNGAPGPRPEYHPGYYGAFIIDPNGWVCFQNYQGESST